MALKFGKTKGTAQKKVDSYAYIDGINQVRIIGDILPRYVYWVKGTNNKDIPVECLAFSREEEKFDNKDKDVVPEFFPELKCSWNYAVNCIDPKDGKVKVLNLKKKLFEQILSAADDLGDPTDYLLGWDLVFKKTKTGPLAFNVSYDLQVLKCKPSALSEEQIVLANEAETIDEKYPRPTSEEIRTLLVKLTTKGGDSDEEGAADSSSQEAVNELES